MPAHQVLMTGDPTLDMLQFATERFDIPIERGDYVLVTIHRAENADSPERLAAIIHGLIGSGAHILFPVHPRTRQRLEGTDLWQSSGRSPSANRAAAGVGLCGFSSTIGWSQQSRH